MSTSTAAAEPLTIEWCEHHFDHISPDLARGLNETLTLMRERCPVTRSDQHGGFWVVNGYANAMTIAQDWRTFSSDAGVGVPTPQMVVRPLPEVSDPPLQQVYKRLINPALTPAAAHVHEDAVRARVTDLLDSFIEDGECEFMAAFARPFPSKLFFEQYLNAPPDDSARLAELSEVAVTPNHPGSADAWRSMFTWITAFVDRRRREPPLGDVVDRIVTAEIDGRPITEDEVIGLVQLLILGGLDTTTGALGQFVIRFCREPSIPELIRQQPERLDDAVEELLRLEGSFISIARTATRDVELGGKEIKQGDKVLFYWASANRDPDEFEHPDEFRLDRSSNRHLAFGVGTHRCAGSNVARMNLRIAVREIATRLRDLQLRVDPGDIDYHSVHNRMPHSVPIRFTPGRRLT